MNRTLLLSFSLACLMACHQVHADPIHPIGGGAYWHHDSGWRFPEKCGEFLRVGIPQDVAGSKDAVAYYAHTVDGSRIVASVDIYPADSAAAAEMQADGSGKLSSEGPFVVGTERTLRGTRRIFAVDGEKNGLTMLYAFAAGEWHVRIRIADANADLAPLLDAFVRDQRWEALNSDSSMTSSTS